MSLIEELWRHVKTTQNSRATPPPPRTTDVWQDLTAARSEIYALSLEVGDLREANKYLANVVEGLERRINDLEANS